MMYITHNGSEITGVFSGDSVSDGAVSVPQHFSGGSGMKLAMFDSNWNRRPVPELISEGLITAPEGFTWDDTINDWRLLTVLERIESGEITLGEREIPDGDFIRDMTHEEITERGLWTEEELLQQLRQATLHRLIEIDQESTRPLRAVLSDKHTEWDEHRLAELEDEAAELRKQLSRL